MGRLVSLGTSGEAVNLAFLPGPIPLLNYGQGSDREKLDTEGLLGEQQGAQGPRSGGKALSPASPEIPQRPGSGEAGWPTLGKSRALPKCSSIL